jgi:hypothetical protein
MSWPVSPIQFLEMGPLSQWLVQLEPIIRGETKDEIICVFANRTGTTDGMVYAGTSAVLGIHAGEVKIYGMLGQHEEELLVVDTSIPSRRKVCQAQNSLYIVSTDSPRKFFAQQRIGQAISQSLAPIPRSLSPNSTASPEMVEIRCFQFLKACNLQSRTTVDNNLASPPLPFGEPLPDVANTKNPDILTVKEDSGDDSGCIRVQTPHKSRQSMVACLKSLQGGKGFPESWKDIEERFLTKSRQEVEELLEFWQGGKEGLPESWKDIHELLLTKFPQVSTPLVQTCPQPSSPMLENTSGTGQRGEDHITQPSSVITSGIDAIESLMWNAKRIHHLQQTTGLGSLSSTTEDLDLNPPQNTTFPATDDPWVPGLKSPFLRPKSPKARLSKPRSRSTSAVVLRSQ